MLKRLKGDKNFYQLIKESISSFVIKIIGVGAGYLLILVISTQYGASVLGMFTLSLTLLQISAVIGKAGTDIALLKLVSKYLAEVKYSLIHEIHAKIQKVILPFALSISLGIFLTSSFIAEAFFHKPELEVYFKVLSLGITPLIFLFIYTEGLRGLNKIKEYIFLQQTLILISTVIVLYIGPVVFPYLPTNMPIYSYIFSIILSCSIAVYFWRKNIVYLLSKEDSRINDNISYKQIFDIAIPMLLSSSLALIMGWSDTLMIGVFGTNEDVGIYSVALKLSALTSLVLVAINSTLAPKFSELWEKNDLDALKKIFNQSRKLIMFSSFPILFILLIFPEFCLSIFGEEFKSANITLIILVVGQFINVIAGSVGYFLQMTGYQKFHQNIILLGATVNILLNYILIPMYGILGAAIASTISVVLWNIIFSFKVNQILSIQKGEKIYE